MDEAVRPYEVSPSGIPIHPAGNGGEKVHAPFTDAGPAPMTADELGAFRRPRDYLDTEEAFFDSELDDVPEEAGYRVPELVPMSFRLFAVEFRLDGPDNNPASDSIRTYERMARVEAAWSAIDGGVQLTFGHPDGDRCDRTIGEDIRCEVRQAKHQDLDHVFEFRGLADDKFEDCGPECAAEWSRLAAEAHAKRDDG